MEIKTLKEELIELIKKLDQDVDVRSIENMNVTPLTLIVDYLFKYNN